MKKILGKGLVFSAVVIALLIAFMLLLQYNTARNSHFEIGKNYKMIILGNSLTECAFDDNLIPGLKNMSQGGESFVYTYLKLKKLHEANPQIKTVIVSYSNNHIGEKMEQLVLHKDNVRNYFPKYAFLMGADEYKLFSDKDILLLERLAMKNNFMFLLKGGSYLQDNNWGGYFFLDKSSKKGNMRVTNVVQHPEFVSETNVNYLAKIVDYCKANGLKVYLIRTPLNLEKVILNNEDKFLAIRNQRFPDAPLLDLVHFKLQPDQYTDNEHIDHTGAKKLSVFFDGLLKKGVLEAANPQQLIDAEIAKQATDSVVAP